MIHRVEIDHFALVEHAEVSLDAGLTVLSGETGAGKSIVIDALDFASGGRSDRSMLRTGEEEAVVSVLFDTRDPQDGGELAVIRGLRDNSRSYAKINGRLATVSELRELTEPLLAIHSQSDQQSIFRESVHRTLLDAFGGEPVRREFTAYFSLYGEFLSADKRLEELFQNPETRQRRRGILAFQAEEIENARLAADEEKKLLKTIRTMTAARDIAQYVGQAVNELGGDDTHSIRERWGRVAANLSAAAKYSSHMQEILCRVETLRSDMSEVIYDLERVYDKLDLHPDELERANQRLSLIRRLQEKYGDSTESVIAYGRKAREELDRLDRTEEELAQLTKKKDDLIRALRKAAGRLSDARTGAAVKLSGKINEELRDLNMKNAHFDVVIDAAKIDDEHVPSDPQQIRFTIAPNPGEPSMPLISIVSGGEASRVLLAVKTVLASIDGVSTLIFDEIDTGISGKTTTMIAAKLKAISRHRQVICVTHSAQIAAAADHHLLIGKQIEGGRTRTYIRRIDGEERVSEVARLLSGNPEDSASRVLAAQLIEGKAAR